MSGTMKNKMQIRGTRIGYVYVLSENSSGSVSAKKLWTFDLLTASTLTMLIAGASEAGDSLDIEMGDGAIIRFPAESLVIDGTDETEIASDTGGSDASGKGTISMTTRGAPTQLGSVPEFLSEIIANKANKFLIVLPFGYTHARTGVATAAKPDGFAYMFGKITNDISFAQGSDNNIQLDFASNKATEFDEDITTATYFDNHGVALKRGGTNSVPAANNQPLKLSSTDVDALKDGDIVIKTVAS